jgi:hypothetical protein
LLLFFKLLLGFIGLVSKRFADNVQFAMQWRGPVPVKQAVEFDILSAVDGWMFLFYSAHCLPQG